MQQKSATTKMKGGIMKTLSNPLLNFDTYIDMKTAMGMRPRDPGGKSRRHN